MEKRYSWTGGVELEEHTRRKHKILREYLGRYLAVRCARPQQTKFRLAVIEGFAGGGRYKCGSAGSPILIIEELRAAVERFNVQRQADGMAPLEIECYLALNDEDPDTLDLLKSHIEPLVAATRSEVPRLHLKVEYFQQVFEALYPAIKERLVQGRYHNVIFNLDNMATATFILRRFPTSPLRLGRPKPSIPSAFPRFLRFYVRVICHLSSSSLAFSA